MKKIILPLVCIFYAILTFGHTINGVATNSETGDPLPGFDILLTYPGGGVASSTTTGPDGTFSLPAVADGTYGLEFYTYPDPIILDGNYFMRTIYGDQITVNGSDVTGIDFQIPPHHPDYTLTGVLYDASTLDTITVQDFEVQAQMQYLVTHFYDPETENGIYILENLPDWTYELTIFDNDYYQGLDTLITIDPQGPDTVQMDFYLEPKAGATVSGVLIDSTTNQPIMQAGRTIRLQAINSLFTETNEQGEYTFINVPPGIYASIGVTSQDTDYVNCTGSEITGFNVPDSGLDNVDLYQKPWISVHHVTADDNIFIPGETKTIRFSIVNDNLVYGSIWGVELQFPDNVTVVNNTPFYNYDSSNVIFDKLTDCGTETIKDWEGWHWVGIPPYATAEGNLDMLNESAWSDVTLQFDNDTTRAAMPVFYEVFYATHCNTIQPFSYGTIMIMNEDIFTGFDEHSIAENRIGTYPNPASGKVTFIVSLDKERKGKITLYNLSGQTVMVRDPGIFKKGLTETTVETSVLPNGIYYYTFLSDDVRLTGKLVLSR